MIKNNKGFTLVELLAIVVILAIIMVVAAPNITKEIQRSEEENENVLNQKIDNAAHIYAAKYYSDDIVNGETISDITLNDLVEDGLISFKNGVCEDQLDNKIIITDGKNYSYDNLSNPNCYIKK